MPHSLVGACQSCLMPFSKDRERAEYCSYCYSDGALCYTGTDVRAFKRAARAAMVARGVSPLKARLYAFMAGFAARWRKG